MSLRDYDPYDPDDDIIITGIAQLGYRGSAEMSVLCHSQTVITSPHQELPLKTKIIMIHPYKKTEANPNPSKAQKTVRRADSGVYGSGFGEVYGSQVPRSSSELSELGNLTRYMHSSDCSTKRRKQRRRRSKLV